MEPAKDRPDDANAVADSMGFWWPQWSRPETGRKTGRLGRHVGRRAAAMEPTENRPDDTASLMRPISPSMPQWSRPRIGRTILFF
jgi:hypothetical protein